ncbi:uncharacterized protein [Lolium perenne]|uniref:uncharacterized protein n=1 Tax=Lolium perenne TaxID=4522 RepID=UPI003A99449B
MAAGIRPEVGAAAAGTLTTGMEEAGQCTDGRRQGSKVQGRGTWRRDAARDQKVEISSPTPPPLQEVGMVSMAKDSALHLLPSPHTCARLVLTPHNIALYEKE